jgi:hypothetical protein
MRGFSRLVSSVGYLAGAAVVGEGLADPAANPHVRVVVAGLQGLDHSRDPGRGGAVGDGVDHVAADPGIGIPCQLEQPRPHPVVVSPDFTGSPEVARQTGTAAGSPLKWLTLEFGGKQESVGRRIRTCARAGHPRC